MSRAVLLVPCTSYPNPRFDLWLRPSGRFFIRRCKTIWPGCLGRRIVGSIFVGETLYARQWQASTTSRASLEQSPPLPPLLSLSPSLILSFYICTSLFSSLSLSLSLKVYEVYPKYLYHCFGEDESTPKRETNIPCIKHASIFPTALLARLLVVLLSCVVLFLLL